MRNGEIVEQRDIASIRAQHVEHAYARMPARDHGLTAQADSGNRSGRNVIKAQATATSVTESVLRLAL